MAIAVAKTMPSVALQDLRYLGRLAVLLKFPLADQAEVDGLHAICRGPVYLSTTDSLSRPLRRTAHPIALPSLRCDFARLSIFTFAGCFAFSLRFPLFLYFEEVGV